MQNRSSGSLQLDVTGIMEEVYFNWNIALRIIMYIFLPILVVNLRHVLVFLKKFIGSYRQLIYQNINFNYDKIIVAIKCFMIDKWNKTSKIYMKWPIKEKKGDLLSGVVRKKYINVLENKLWKHPQFISSGITRGTVKVRGIKYS